MRVHGWQITGTPFFLVVQVLHLGSFISFSFLFEVFFLSVFLLFLILLRCNAFFSSSTSFLPYFFFFYCFSFMFSFSFSSSSLLRVALLVLFLIFFFFFFFALPHLPSCSLSLSIPSPASLAWKQNKEKKEGKNERRKRKEGKKERRKRKEGRKARKEIKERQKEIKKENQRKKVKGKKGKQTLETKGFFFVYRYLGVLGQTTTKEGKKEETGKKEGKQGNNGKTDRKIRERKGKETKVKKLWKKGFSFVVCFYLFLCFCVLLDREQPYIFIPKSWKSSFQNPQKTYFYNGLGPKRQNKLDSPKKTITFAHANIIGHVQNARKSFHLFWGLFCLGLVFIALANLTT